MCMAEGFKRTARKKETKYMQIQFLLIFSYDSKSSTTKGISSIVNQFTALQVYPGSAWACCPSMHVYEGQRGKQRKCVFASFVLFLLCVCVYLRCRQAPGQGTSSLSPGHGGWERMRRMEGVAVEVCIYRMTQQLLSLVFSLFLWPWEFGSGKVSLATKCITVVFPKGSLRAPSVTLPCRKRPW